MASLEAILADVSVGLTALAEAGRGQIEIGADKLLHLPPIGPFDEEVEPRKTREAVFNHIGSVRLPDLLLDVATATHYSEALRRANERVSEYQIALAIAALWGDGTKGSADMMAMDASRHLWTARVDARRRTHAAGLYTAARPASSSSSFGPSTPSSAT